jgi:hypothetical protein
MEGQKKYFFSSEISLKYFISNFI